MVAKFLIIKRFFITRFLMTAKCFKLALFFYNNTIFYASKISGVALFFMTTHSLMVAKFFDDSTVQQILHVQHHR